MRRTRTVGLALSWTLLLASPSWPGPPSPEASPRRGLTAWVVRRAAEIGSIPPDRRPPVFAPAEPPRPLDQMVDARRAPVPTPPTAPLVIPAVPLFEQFKAGQDEFHRVMGGPNAGTTGPLADAPPVPASTTIDPRTFDSILIGKATPTIVPAPADPLVIPAALPLPPHEAAAAQADFDRGVDDYKAGRYDEAIAALGRVIAASPDWALPRAYRGASLLFKREHDRAIVDLNAAIRLDPANSYAFYCRGAAMASKREYRRAVVDYDEALRLNPGRPEILSYRGTARYALHDFGGAAADMESILRFQPRDSDAIHRLAWLRAICPEARIRDGRAAVALATSACEIDGWTSHDSLATLAAAHAEAGDFDAALRRQCEAMAKVRGWHDWTADVVEFLHYAARQPYRWAPVLADPDAESQNMFSVRVGWTTVLGLFLTLDWGPPRCCIVLGWRSGCLPVIGWY